MEVGEEPETVYTPHKIWKKTAILCILIILVGIAVPIIFFLIENPNPSVTQVRSGLVDNETLNEIQTKEQLDNQQYWRFAGSAIPRNASYDYFEDTSGLHIGVRTPLNGAYAGFFAVTQETEGRLFHAVVSSTTKTIASKNNYFQNGLYVQTANGSVNYVACVSVTSSTGTIWSVGQAEGDTGGAKRFRTLWVDNSTHQPLTRECTIITNGQNYLKVYLDNVPVYSNNKLSLPMPHPFLSFLEVQSSYSGEYLYGTYRDFYITSDESVDIINIPPTDKVKLVSSSGKVLANGPSIAGKATLNIGQYHLPLNAKIIVYNSTGAILVSTTNPVNVFGGDVYSASSNWLENLLASVQW